MTAEHPYSEYPTKDVATIYTIRRPDGTEWIVEDPKIAEFYSKAGETVTAVTTNEPDRVYANRNRSHNPEYRQP